MGYLQEVWAVRRFLILYLTPVLFSPIPICIQSSEAYTAYVIIIMAVYWCTEAMPLAATSFLPIIMFPLFGVLPSSTVCAQYLKDLNFLFFGGLLVAVAVEHTNLHKRIALRVLLFMGSKPKWLMLGFMITTAFLSMWVSNTATTAMMVPIVQAVIDQIKKNDATNYIELNALENNAVEEEKEPRYTEHKQHGIRKNEWLTRMNKGLLICVPYAANIGGTATITGTAPNLVASNLASTDYGSVAGVNFLTWMLFAIPSMIVCLFFAWIWLQYMFLGCSCKFWRCSCLHKQEHDQIDTTNEESVTAVLRQQYNALGKVSFAEKAVLFHFVILLLLWITRDPKFIPGWSVWFKEKYVTDSTCAMLISVSLFMFPVEPPGWTCRRPTTKKSSSPAEAASTTTNDCGSILTWPAVHQKMAWNVIILLGGGFAMAEACKESGLSKWIGIQLSSLDQVPPAILLFAITILIAFLTEFTSNTSTANIFLPLMAELVKAGAIMNIICIVVTNININTLGRAVFDVHLYPDWIPTPSDAIPTTDIIGLTTFN
ncbi:Na(+)/citrate cotransporter-like isoform X2 [Antedon mediterranea]|uniref:Na(+)/citrate cotransporter-like isoform X2 n=1 Tax=Antedon mediterranea TaxID=105859 RepID=UPI003AF6AD31